MKRNQTICTGDGIRLLEETYVVFPSAAGVLEEDAKKASRPISFISRGIEEAPPSSVGPTTCRCRAHPTTLRAPRGAEEVSPLQQLAPEGGREGGRRQRRPQRGAGEHCSAASGRGGKREDKPGRRTHTSKGGRASRRAATTRVCRSSRIDSPRPTYPAPPEQGGVAELADLLPVIVLTEARFVEQGTPRPPRSEVALLHARRAWIR
jgi:hypothetical protein